MGIQNMSLRRGRHEVGYYTGRRGCIVTSLVSVFLCLSLALLQSTNGYCEFGYISYSGGNIGDDIQALAAKRFLPEKSIPIDREWIGEFQHSGTVPTIVNGWYMCTKHCHWNRDGISAPEKSWPPAPCIQPLFISWHITDTFLPMALSDESVAYLKQHAPIGARDYGTLQALQSKGIPSYFSGCLTLTLENDAVERDEIIYAVDIGAECFRALRARTRSRIKVVHHWLRAFALLNNEQRLQYAVKLLKMYSRAKCVVTTRLHAAMPCLGLKTPVLLITNKNDSRFSGLRELTRWCTKQEFVAGTYAFDCDNPPNNPTTYLPLRERLIETVTQWVNIHGGEKK